MNTCRETLVLGEMDMNNNFYLTDDQILLFGPLWLDRKKYKVMTVFFTEAYLSEDEFKTLFLLASHEGRILTFEYLYSGAWEKYDGEDRREEAHKGISRVMKLINVIEPEMLCIDYHPGLGYAFRLHEVYSRSARLMQGIFATPQLRPV
jgi:DNA-binding response OmpR family regulator